MKKPSRGELFVHPFAKMIYQIQQIDTTKKWMNGSQKNKDRTWHQELQRNDEELDNENDDYQADDKSNNCTQQ